MVSRGNKVISMAASLAIISFFLPWLAVSCASQPVAVTSLNGWQLAAGNVQTTILGAPPVASSPELFVSPLAAVACLVVVFLVYQSRMTPQTAASVALAAALLSLFVLITKLLTTLSQAAQSGIAARIELVNGMPTIIGGLNIFKIELLYGFWAMALSTILILVGAVIDLRKPSKKTRRPPFY